MYAANLLNQRRGGGGGVDGDVPPRSFVNHHSYVLVPGRTSKPPSCRRPHQQLRPHQRSRLGLASRTSHRTRLHPCCEKCKPEKNNMERGREQGAGRT